MAKKIVFNYEFDADEQKITLLDDVYPKRRLLMITNVTSGEIIYLFNDATKSGTFAFDYDDYTTTITLDYDTTAMDDADELQIFVEWDNQTVDFDESYVDPVSKIRVSQPENLIDTDFEYGLQSTKWETLELTKNIPTFYSRNGDLSFEIDDITVQSGSNTVTVVTVSEHGLQRGTPILVQGTASSLCDGGFTSLSVINDTTFTYQAKSNLSFSGSIKTTNTQVFQGSIYSGTEFKIRSIAGITSDGVAEGSTLTVTTEYPTDFVAGTKFALTNSFASAGRTFSTANVDIENVSTDTKTVTIGYTSEASSNTSQAMTTIQPYNYSAKDNRSIYIDPNDVTVNNGDIYFTNGHGRPFNSDTGVTDNMQSAQFTFYYDIPFGETPISPLQRGRFYIARYIDANRLRVFPYVNNTGNSSDSYPYYSDIFAYYAQYNFNKINITSIPARSTYKHAFLGGYFTNRSDRTQDRLHMYYNRYIAYNFNWPSRSHINTFTTSDNSYDFSDNDGIHLIAGDTSNSASIDNGLWSNGSSAAEFRSLSVGSSSLTYVYGGSSNTSYIPSRFGTYRMSLATVNAIDHVSIPLQLNNNRNTIFLSNHGFLSGDTVVYTLTSGTQPSGLVSGRTYIVTRISSDRFKLNYNGSEVDLSTHGSIGAVLNFSVTSINPNADTIEIAENTFQEGDAVLYTDGGGTAIGGLVSGDTYYVYRKSGDRFRLASDPNLVTGVSVSMGSTRSWNTTYFRTDNTIRPYFLNTHGFTTGNAILYTQTSGNPVGDLKSGNIYYVRAISSVYFALYSSRSDALSDTSRIRISIPSGFPLFTENYAVDFTSKPSPDEDHVLGSSFVGAADGNYTLATTSADQMSFTLSSNSTILGRQIETTVQNSFIENEDAFYYRDHGFATGADVVYTSSQLHFSGLTSGATYYVIPLDRNRFQLATSQDNASQGIAVSLSSSGSSSSPITDVISFQGNSIVAAAAGNGTIAFSSGGIVVSGDGTLFNSLFKSGDTIKVSPETTEFGYEENSNSIITTVAGSSTPTSHNMNTGDSVAFRLVSGAFPDGDLLENRVYYIRDLGSTTIALYYTRSDAIAGTNQIILSGTGYYSNVRIIPLDRGEIIERVVDYVNSNTQLEVTDPFETSATSGTYFINSQLLLRPDGFALHRPYDGGVELIPPTNPDSQMIRQTRKYFRYQSGKGIQVSFAVNFSPTTQVDDMYYDGSGDLYLKTRFPHRLSAGLEIEVSEATGSNADNFNGVRSVSSIIDDYTAVLDTGVSGSANIQIQGNAEFYVKGWNNSSLKCGLFDDQNGIFFSYDGGSLSCNVRSSIRQIAGTSQLTFRSGDVNGTGTKFLSQLVKGQYVVIKGQSYQVTKISSDTLFHITPSYRGTDAQGVIITVTETNSTPQEQWNLDKADGTGYTGFQLDLSRIQMAYIDYSWYGAGKVRFGFKDQHGKVQYVHEFVHGNFKTEAYMRSGNIPARYEIQNNGLPSYVPALAHWGTSVIMDGRFDDDKAYVFNASGNNISTTGSNSLTFTGEIETLKKYREPDNGNIFLNYAVHVEVPDAQLNAAFAKVGITGAGLASGTVLALPESTSATYYQPYQPSVKTRISGEGSSTDRTRTLMLIDRAPTALPTPDPQTGLTTSTYTLDLDVGEGGADASQVTRNIPLISVRLAPSVDTSTVGKLGEREIINRMQLILSQVSILTTHTAEIKLILNGLLSTNAWQRVTNPSLSELIYHGGNDTISGGAALFSFRASGDTGTTRSQQLTTQALGDVATLGNSILGGDQPFPDGPDVLTVVATLTEDPSTVNSSTPFSVSGRISWSESQA